MAEPIVITRIVKTCDSCPAQWEGTTADGQTVYVRYRWGILQIGVAKTMIDAVSQAMWGDGNGFYRTSIAKAGGNQWDGCLDYDTLKLLAPEFVWPEAETERETGGSLTHSE